MKKFLFIGWYPNPIENYKNVFFQNLIFSLADLGVCCTVISPVSYTHYRRRVNRIKSYVVQKTRKGNNVQVYYPRFISFSSKNILGCKTGVISEYAFEKSALKIARYLVKQGEKFDAVYGHFFLYGGLAAIRIGRDLKIPSFVAYGECDYESQIQRPNGDLKRKNIEGLTGIIAVSTKNANRLLELGIFYDIPILVAPNAIDHSIFHPLDRLECRSKLELPPDKFIVGFVGGFIERKGDKRLLEAVNGLNDVFLACAGRGAVPPSGERVLFCEPMEHKDIPILLSAVDVFCLPTLSEGSCNAIIEAMACGVPVISSNLLFNDDVLNENNAIRINPRSITEIQEAIITVKSNTNLRNQLKKEALRTAEELSIENRAKKILNFILEKGRVNSDKKS